MSEIKSLSKQGKSHTKNQDSFSIPGIKHNTIEKGYLICVCDGVGGYMGGEIASKICAESIINEYYSQTTIEDIPIWFKETLQKINDKILQMAEVIAKPKMSTTIACLLLKDNRAYCQNCGDSRIYLYANGTLKQITEDHSPIWKEYKAGRILGMMSLLC